MLTRTCSRGLRLPPAASRPAAAAASCRRAANVSASSGQPAPRAAQATRGRNEEFHPALHPKRQEDRARSEQDRPHVAPGPAGEIAGSGGGGGGRNLFQFGPPPPAAGKEGTAAKLPERRSSLGIGAETGGSPAAAGASARRPRHSSTTRLSRSGARGGRRPFSWKATRSTGPPKGELVKRRYRVVRIGLNSVVLEDIELKRQSPCSWRRMPAGKPDEARAGGPEARCPAKATGGPEEESGYALLLVF